MEYGGWFIGIFAILVGCFSIANIMFVSVRERTRIIGVQKAIGAKSNFIMLQFLFEAVALCVIGALFALIAIEAIVLAVNAVDVGFLLQVRPSRIIIALSVAVASGLSRGWPRRAGRQKWNPWRPCALPDDDPCVNFDHANSFGDRGEWPVGLAVDGKPRPKRPPHRRF